MHNLVNNYSEEWSIIPLKKNEKYPPQCKEWEKKKYDRANLEGHNGNYGLSAGAISDDIHIVDWDFRKGYNRKDEGFKVILKEYEKQFPNLVNTRICKTPNGFHFYYIVRGSKARKTENKNGCYEKNSFISKNKIRFGKYLAGLDTRANGSYAVIPPSKVDGIEYKWYNNNPILEITEKDYETILDFFRVKEEDIANFTMRKGFVDIANGKIDPNTYEIPEDKSEQVLWKEFYHEAHTCCGLKPEDLLEGLEKFNKGFDLEKTLVQINNEKTRNYILNGNRLKNDKYAIYFPNHQNGNGKSIADAFANGDKKEAIIYLEGAGDIHLEENGIYLEKFYKKGSTLFLVLDGKLEILSKTINKQGVELFTFNFNGRQYHTYSILEAIKRLEDKIYQHGTGRDVIKRVFNVAGDTINTKKAEYVLGFNDGWKLPITEKDFIIICYTEMQLNTYERAKNIVEKKYSEKKHEEVKQLMQEFIKITQTNKTKLAVIIGWSMASPFRLAILDYCNILPHLYLHGKRYTGKSALLYFWITKFFGIYDNYLTSITLTSISRLEDHLSESTFAQYIQEAHKIKLDEIIQLIKEHATASGLFERKKNAKELDLSKPKVAPLCIDSNNIIKEFKEAALNTKILPLEFTKKDAVSRDGKWLDLSRKLKSKRLFTYIYEITKDWNNETVRDRLDAIYDKIEQEIKNITTIEETYERLIPIYQIIRFGLELFEEAFDVKFNTSKILDLLMESRRVLPRELKDQFYTLCRQAINYDYGKIDDYGVFHRGDNPPHLTTGLELREISNQEYYIFTQENKQNFNRCWKTIFSLKELGDLLPDALEDKTAIQYNWIYKPKKIRVIRIKKDWLE